MTASGEVTIKVKPDLSAFTEASEADVAAAVEYSSGTPEQVARDLLARFWIVPR